MDFKELKIYIEQSILPYLINLEITKRDQIRNRIKYAENKEILNEALKYISEETGELFFLEDLEKKFYEENLKVIKEETKIEEAIESFTNYLDMAERFLKIQPLYFDKNNIWWLWNFENKSWEIVDEIDIMNIIDKKVNVEKSTNASIKNAILEALKRKSRLNKPKDVKLTWVQFKNKIIDLENDAEFDSTPEYFSTNPIPLELGKDEETPTIDKIFEEWVGTEYKQTLYEILAFNLSQTYFVHRIFCFVGSGLNGKSKFFGLLKNFIGEKNCTSTELDVLLNSRFESAKLYKKLVCIMGETNFNTLNKTSLIKRLTGQDLIGFEFKNKKPFDDSNYAKIMIATNTLPLTLDKTEGFYRRWSIIDFPNKFSEKQDILETIPKEEYKSLALKCVKILKKLWVTREFTNEGTIQERAKRYEEKSNPLTLFIKENYKREIDSKIPFFEFYDLYESFLKERRYRLQSKIEVGKLLGFEGLEKRRVSVKNKEGELTSIYFIFGLKANNNNNNNNNDIPTLSLSWETNEKKVINVNNVIIEDDKRLFEDISIEELDLSTSAKPNKVEK